MTATVIHLLDRRFACSGRPRVVMVRLRTAPSDLPPGDTVAAYIKVPGWLTLTFGPLPTLHISLRGLRLERLGSTFATRLMSRPPDAGSSLPQHAVARHDRRVPPSVTVKDNLVSFARAVRGPNLTGSLDTISSTTSPCSSGLRVRPERKDRTVALEPHRIGAE